jgi:hypothetical protein
VKILTVFDVSGKLSLEIPIRSELKLTVVVSLYVEYVVFSTIKIKLTEEDC